MQSEINRAEMDEEDLHLCFKCQQTFIGLDIYVKHRKDGCKGISQNNRSDDKILTPNQRLSISSRPRQSIDGDKLIESDTVDVQCNLNCGKSTNLREFIVYVSHPNDTPSRSSVVTPIKREICSSQSVTSSPPEELKTSSINQLPQRGADPAISKANTFSFAIPTSGLLSPGLNTDHLDTNFMLESQSNTKNHDQQIEPVHQSAASVAEFFTSLELKHREPTSSEVVHAESDTATHQSPTSKIVKHVSEAETRPVTDTQHDHSYNTNVEQHQETFEERLKHLKIVNILNDLDFDSDSEGLPSDVDELLNFNDEEYYRETRPAGGGKWKPGGMAAQYHSRGKGGKLASHMRHAGGKNMAHTGGKWKPGTGPSTPARPSPRYSGGKLSAYKSYKGLTDSEDEEEQEAVEQDKGLVEKSQKGDRGSSKCVTCQKTFSTKYYLANHIKTPAHKKRLAAAAGKKKAPPSHQCPLCKSFFSTKENFLRHLSKEIKRNEADSPEKVNLSENLQILLQRRQPFQCRMCAFFADSSKALVTHLGTESHVQKCAAQMHPLICVRCRFSCIHNRDMLAHFETPEHAKAVETSDRPCVVKESKIQVICKECDSIVLVSKLQDHISTEHFDECSTRKTKRVRYKPFCVCCDKQWESESALSVHLARKGGYKPYPCPICNQAFTTNSDLTRHCQSEKHVDGAIQLGTKSPRYNPVPSQCDSATNSHRLDDTLSAKRKRTSKAKGYMCKWDGCDFRAAKYTELRQHYAAHSAEGARFQCKLCNYFVNQKSHFDMHKRTARHLRLAAGASSVNTHDSPKQEVSLLQDCGKSEERSLNECQMCDQKFSTIDALNEHQVSHVTFSEKEFIKQCGGDELKYCAEKYHPYVKQLPIESTAVVTCPECDKSMPRHAIIAHLRFHANIKPFQCIFCEKAFAKGDNLRTHIYFKHIHGKKLCCEYCSQRYSVEHHLKQHMLSKHRDKVTFKPNFVCSQCGMEFMVKSLFRSHEKIHEQEKPFSCPVPGCFVRFSTKSGLVCHTRRHNKEKTHLCDFCGFATLTMAELRRHERIHSNNRMYKCDYCSYSSVTSSGLVRHKRIHSGSKAYRCPHCTFRGPDLNRLRKHCFKKKDHQGLKLYQCHLCSHGFDKAKVFQNHLLAEHTLKVSVMQASVLAGIFDESANAKTVAEGSMVIPVQEKFYRKHVRASLESFQNEYLKTNEELKKDESF